MKRTILLGLFLVIALSCSLTASAQFRYQSGRIIIGDIEPYSFYAITALANGVYLQNTGNRFLQIDVSAYGAPRVAGHSNQVVFFNTAKSVFNSIQVDKVYNYSDAKAKTSVQSLNNGMAIIQKLRPVSYNFVGEQAVKNAAYNQFTGYNAEMGLIAQEVEEVLPNLVFTDEEGRKLINYTALIPALIDAVKTLQQEVDALKNSR